MKRYLLLLCAVLLTGAVRAQRLEKNLLGVRAGLELSYIRATGEYVYGTTNPRTGFRLGVSDQVLLWRGIPLYVETGVHFSSRGGRFNGASFRPMYLQFPLLATWRFRLGEQVSIRPYVGVCYDVGIGGKARTPEGWDDLFGNAGFIRRSDLTLRAGAEVSWRRICLSAGFDAGSLDLLRPDYQTPLLPAGIERLRSRSFTLCIGYDF